MSKTVTTVARKILRLKREPLLIWTTPQLCFMLLKKVVYCGVAHKFKIVLTLSQFCRNL